MAASSSPRLSWPLLALVALYCLTEIMLQYGATAVVHMANADPDRLSEVRTRWGDLFIGRVIKWYKAARA